MKVAKRIFNLMVAAFFSVMMVVGGGNDSLAASNTEIEVKSIVSSTMPVTNKFTYKITPRTTNVPGATNEPTELVLEFDDLAPDDAGLVKVTGVIDFKDANYVNAGNYKYLVSEVASSNAQTYPTSHKQWEVYVLVRPDAVSGQMNKQVYAQALDIGEDIKGEIEFFHQAVTYIVVENYVVGEMANTGEYFKYRLEILGKVGEKFQIQGQDATVNYRGNIITTTTEYEVKDGADNFVDIYLRDKQTIEVGLTKNGSYQIPVGTRYRVVKEKVDKWYTTINDQYFSTELEKMEFLVAGLNPTENKIIVVNERNFDVPLTGVFMRFWPFLVLILLMVVGLILLRKTRRDGKKGRKSKRTSAKNRTSRR